MTFFLRSKKQFLVWLGVGALVACAFDTRDTSVRDPNAGGAAGSSVMGSLQPAPVEPSCGAGQYRCNGALLQTCADDRQSWVTVKHCAQAALCQADPAACLAAACGVDEMSCAGAVLQRCKADRTGWDVFATCASPAHCNADLRQCMPEPCLPGDRRCDRSDVDQSPVLETCRDDRQDWAPLAGCVTHELCDQTLHPAMVAGVMQESDPTLPLAAPTPAPGATCLLPACAVGEMRCEGTQLEVCAEGRTGVEPAERCATPALCQASLTNVSSNGTPTCLPAACAPNEHRCGAGGVLQVCNEDRTGFRVIQTCIGAAYCNATLADQGQEGCRSTPCEAGQMQCNGAQIQVCRADRSALDDTGAPCESAGRCNASDPANAFCEAPSCRRGATSSSEFLCDGAALQRCNESLSGYETIETCVTAAQCDASQRFLGCQVPVCQPGEHACSEGFLQTCKADLTGFENTRDCSAEGACDASAGQCTAPCEAGAVRCNTQSGDLEECRDPLAGWQTVADCLSLPLCDAANRRCNPPLCATGARHCETRGENPVIVECAPGREAFNVSLTCAPGEFCDAQNGECDVCTPSAARCEGDTLVTCDANGQSESREACGAGLCSATERRCLGCGPIGSARCTSQQLLVCTQSPQGEFEASEFCDTDALCAQTLDTCGAGLGGQTCQCNDGVCRANQVSCNGAQLQRCNAGLTGFDTIDTCGSPELCNAATGDCNTCVASQFSCAGGQLRQCANDGRSFARQNIGVECASASQLRVCNGTGAGLQNCPNGCTNGRGCNQCTGNGVQCVNGNTIRRCVDGFFQDQSCQLGCNTNSTQCNACQGNGTSCSNGNTQQSCVNGQFTSSNCPQGCVAGRCANCTASRCANGNQRQECLNGQFQNPTSCSDGNACNGNEGCLNGNCTAGQTLFCNDNNQCTNDSCNPGSGCVFTPNNNSCSDGIFCNGNETCGGGRCNSSGAVSCPQASNACADNTCVESERGCVEEQRAGCLVCNGPFCIGNIHFDCVGGAQGASTNCDDFAQICDPDLVCTF